MANEHNLKPITTLSKEEAKKRGSAGGKASAEARRRKKTMREQAELLLSLPFAGNGKEAMRNLGISDDDMSNQMAMLAVAFQKSLKGDIRSMEFIRDTAGEKPVQQVEVSAVDADVVNEVEEMVSKFSNSRIDKVE